MRKLFSYYVFFISLILMSCNKTFVRTEPSGIESSTDMNFRFGQTGVSLSQASDLAVNFLKSKSHNLVSVTINGTSNDPSSGNVYVKDATTITSEGKPYFHVINTNAGFVILSSDSLYRPIVAFDSVNNFSYKQEDMNLGLAMWMTKHARQLEYARNGSGVEADSIRNENKKLWIACGHSFLATKGNGSDNISNPNRVGATNRVGVNYGSPTIVSVIPVHYQTTSIKGPFCNTAWGQVSPWNQYCPVDNALPGSPYAAHDPAGCVPVAMAQLMYYWKWPASYNWTPMVKAIISNNSTTWPSVNPGGFTGSAQLMSDIGNRPGTFWTTAAHSLTSSRFASYDKTGTDCDQEYCGTIFNSFGYTTASTSQLISTQISNSSPQNGIAYESLITSELQAGRPCLVGGYSGQVWDPLILRYVPSWNHGHTWVCDGSQVMTFYDGTQTTLRYGDGHTEVVTVYPDVSSFHMLYMNWGYSGTDNAWYDAYTSYSNILHNRIINIFRL